VQRSDGRIYQGKGGGDARPGTPTTWIDETQRWRRGEWQWLGGDLRSVKLAA